MLELHAPLEDVGVVARVVAGRIRTRQAEQRGQLGQEQLVVGALAYRRQTASA